MWKLCEKRIRKNTIERNSERVYFSIKLLKFSISKTVFLRTDAGSNSMLNILPSFGHQFLFYFKELESFSPPLLLTGII